MMTTPDTFGNWIQERASKESFFSGTFWFLFSNLPEPDLIDILGLQNKSHSGIPGAELSRTMTVRKRTGKELQATFWHMPVRRDGVHVLFSVDRPSIALRPMYRLLARTRGKVHLFPIGYPIVKSCIRLASRFSLEDTQVLRGVSYPSRPSEGGADINLRPGNARVFFARLEEEKRVLKTARFKAPTADNSYCEFTLGRPGYISYHKGDFGPFFQLIEERLTQKMSDSVKPFQRAKGHFVEFRFSEPLFVDRANYSTVLEALSRLPRTSLALLHTNPYFHAALTNYEDGGEFDIFITGHSTIYIQGNGEASPAAFLRIQNGFTECFRDASISLEQPTHYSFRDLIEGKV